MRIRLVLLLGLISAGMSAQSTKTLLIDRQLNSDPVRIVKVTAGTMELKSDGTRFPNKYSWQAVIDNATEDWLTGLSLTIQNVSTKKIVYIGVACNVAETANWQEEIARHSPTYSKSPEAGLGTVNNRVGLRPEAALYSPSLGHKLHPDPDPAFELAPGQTYTIPFEDPSYYPSLKSSVEERKGSMSSVNACNGGISQVFFEDGTQWQGHRYYRADVKSPRYWVGVSAEEWATTK